MNKNLLSLVLLSALILTGCQNQQAGSVKVAGKSCNIDVKVGQSFIIKLESNATTGYSWRLAEHKPGIVEKVSNTYVPSKTEGRMVGSGGIEEWTFKAIAKGKVIIILEYVRPWEKDVLPAKHEIYQVIVK